MTDLAPAVRLNPNGGFVHPEYAGTDPAYLAWLAQADLSSADAVSKAKKRRGDANTAYQQALADLSTQATGDRRGLQTNMLSRGLFRSGEFDRRKTELNSAYDQANKKAAGVLETTLGGIDDDERATISGLGMQGVTQVSQAMLRDSLAAYEAQQQAATPAAAAPPAPYSAPAAPRALATTPAGAPVINSTAALYQAQSKPKKAASGSTGTLTQKRSGLQ